MSATTLPPIRTVGDLLRRLGDVPPDRIRWTPTPGTATLDDLLRTENEMCELVDGTLVEKTMGQEESFLAMWLGTLLNGFIRPPNLGYITGPDGFVVLPAGGPVRGPDVAYFSWASIPDRRRPDAPIPVMAPDLAVEILSESNTAGEMRRKRAEYLVAGVRLVWEIDPRDRTCVVYAPNQLPVSLTAADTLDGGDVLPGFALPLSELFAELDRRGA